MTEGIGFGPDTELDILVDDGQGINDGYPGEGYEGRYSTEHTYSVRRIKIKDIREGMIIHGNRTRNVVHSVIVSPKMEMISFVSGYVNGICDEAHTKLLWIGRNHLVRNSRTKSEWQRADQYGLATGRVEIKECYNLILETNKENPYHMIYLRGLEAVTINPSHSDRR